MPRTRSGLDIPRPARETVQSTPWEAFRPAPWTVHAACTKAEPDLFFPTEGQGCADAKAVCAICPVTKECLDDAVERDEKHGVWGGLSRRERYNLSPRREWRRRA